MSLLVLGGTKDARELAGRWIKAGIDVIYSIQGLVRTPKLDCEIVVGGFSERGGLASFIRQKQVQAIVDATHPYAATITQKAIDAAKETDIPCWAFHREAWQQQRSDCWVSAAAWPEALDCLRDEKTVFLSAGQIPNAVSAQIADRFSDKIFILRTAVKPALTLPANVRWIKAIGPFSIEDETALLEQNKIDILISKNSGGESTYAKIIAARAQHKKVIMLARPKPPNDVQMIADTDACFSVVNHYFKDVKETLA